VSSRHPELCLGLAKGDGRWIGVRRMLTEDEKQRYDRQIRINGFGLEGQEKLKRARVLVAGAGALGSVIATYLALAGVGSLRVVDDDVVELSNLNRQILHWSGDVGKAKTQSAEEKLRQANPCVHVEAVAARIGEDNALELASGCDLIMDAVDNYDTRYALNRAALESGIPFIHGGVYAMEGMATTIVPGQTACLKCIFAAPPPPTTIPVLGAITGIVGCLQATEAVKYITGIGELLANRLLVVDGVDLRFREVRLQRNAECPDCSPLGPVERKSGRGT